MGPERTPPWGAPGPLPPRLLRLRGTTSQCPAVRTHPHPDNACAPRLLLYVRVRLPARRETYWTNTKRAEITEATPGPRQAPPRPPHLSVRARAAKAASASGHLLHVPQRLRAPGPARPGPAALSVLAAAVAVHAKQSPTAPFGRYADKPLPIGSAARTPRLAGGAGSPLPPPPERVLPGTAAPPPLARSAPAPPPRLGSARRRRPSWAPPPPGLLTGYPAAFRGAVSPPGGPTADTGSPALLSSAGAPSWRVHVSAHSQGKFLLAGPHGQASSWPR